MIQLFSLNLDPCYFCQVNSCLKIWPIVLQLPSVIFDKYMSTFHKKIKFYHSNFWTYVWFLDTRHDLLGLWNSKITYCFSKLFFKNKQRFNCYSFGLDRTLSAMSTLLWNAVWRLLQKYFKHKHVNKLL